MTSSSSINLSAHRVAGVREVIQATGASILYLPPYSRSSDEDGTPAMSAGQGDVPPFSVGCGRLLIRARAAGSSGCKTASPSIEAFAQAVPPADVHGNPNPML